MENIIKGFMTNKGVAKYDFNELSGNLVIPSCPTFPIWLCDSSTNEYTSPMGQYKSTCSLSSDEFLEIFWNYFLKDYDDGYKVTKRILGRDQSNTYDIYEYTFTPKKYSRTVLISTGMHPSELPAEFGLAYFMKYVMEKQSADFKWIHDNVRFKIIPLIQPWGFNQNPLKYENSTGVNINKNWDVDHVWTPDFSFGGTGTNGSTPYSEAETKVLVNWINENAYKVDLWIDCHTDSSGQMNGSKLHYVTGCSDADIRKKVLDVQRKITQAYVAAGFFEPNTENTLSSAGMAAATSFSSKHLYAKKYCGIPSLMIEQYSGNPLWGGDPEVNNSEADINNYITNIRALLLGVLERDEITIDTNNMFYYIYQWLMENHYSILNSKYEYHPSETYTLSFVINGHGEQPETLMGINTIPSTLPVLTDVNDRYRFDGWYTDERFIIKAQPNEILLSDQILYAKWVDTESDIHWYNGAINTQTGMIMDRLDRAHTDFIKVKENGIIEITNMSDYLIVDVAVYKENISYISLTNNYTLTQENGTWFIKLNDFYAKYPTGKYIRFSVKRSDASNISLSEFNDTVINTN